MLNLFVQHNVKHVHLDGFCAEASQGVSRPWVKRPRSAVPRDVEDSRMRVRACVCVRAYVYVRAQVCVDTSTARDA